MKLSSIRIVILTLIVAGIAAAGFLISLNAPKQNVAAAEPATWLPMPADGMDARQWPIRELLSYIQGPGSAVGTLATRCGSSWSDDKAESVEQYSVQIGDPTFTPDLQHWRIDFVPDGDSIDVTLDAISPYPPPPPPQPTSIGQGRSSPNSVVHDWTAQFRRKRTDMQSIRDAIADKDLWLAPQKEDPFGCTDGRSVVIEACVHGQYFARLRNCDFASGEPAQRLWNLLRQQFPKPAQPQ